MQADLIKALYRGVLRIRMVEEAIAQRYKEQEMRCPVHLCIGQEGVSAAVGLHLKGTDYAVSGHRSHGHYLAKGGDLKAMIAELYGKVSGCCRGKGGSMHLIDLEHGFLGAVPIVGSTIPIGVGAALGAQLSKEDRVAAIFLGDGACEEGVFHESLNFAALKKLPALFVCENNLYSVYTPLNQRQPENRDLASVASGHGIKVLKGDGNNAVEVHALTGEAMSCVRAGGGPVFMEFANYRWLEHCGPNYDNHIGYRTEAEYESWRPKCPLEFMEKQLQEHLEDSASFVEAEKKAIACEIEEAFQYATKSEFPPREELGQHLYAER